MQTAYDRGWRNVKLYFMIVCRGRRTPTCSVPETGGLIKTVAGNKARKRDRFTLTLTLSNSPPSPTRRSSGTQPARKSSSAVSLLKEALKKVDGVKSNWTSIRISAMEDAIGRGDRRCAG